MSTHSVRPKPGAAGRLIAVASGKGGVGKTWFAITLAHALTRQGRRVLLFDGDLGLANVDIQLGLTPEHDLGAVMEGSVSLSEAAVRHPEAGFDIIAGRSGSGALAAMDSVAVQRVLNALREAAQRYDDVLLDLGAGLDRAVRQMSAQADVLLVMATDEPTSLTDAYAVLKLHATDAAGSETLLVVNQATNGPGGERTYETLRRACLAFLGRAPACAGIIRRDDKVRDAIRRQTPLLTRHPTSSAAADVERIATRLATNER